MNQPICYNPIVVFFVLLSFWNTKGTTNHKEHEEISLAGYKRTDIKILVTIRMN
jgi:hypothetical protein